MHNLPVCKIAVALLLFVYAISESSCAKCYFHTPQMQFTGIAAGKFLPEEDSKKSMFDIEAVNVRNTKYDILTIIKRGDKHCIARLDETPSGKRKVSLKTLTKTKLAGYDFTGCARLNSIKEYSDLGLLSAEFSQHSLRLLCPSLVKADGSCTLTTDKDPEQKLLIKTVLTIGSKTSGQMELAVVSPDTGLCLSVGVSKANDILYDLSDSLCAPAYTLLWASEQGKLRDFNDNKASLQCSLFPEYLLMMKKKNFLQKLKEALTNPEEAGKNKLLVHPIILSNGNTISMQPGEHRRHYRNLAAEDLLEALPKMQRQVADASVTVEQWKSELREIIRCSIDYLSYADDMVVASDGRTYYNANVQKVAISPFTRDPLNPADVFPNRLIMKIYELVANPEVQSA